MPCAPGTAFNPAIGVCDWPYKVPGCNGKKLEDKPKTSPGDNEPTVGETKAIDFF